MAYIVNTFDIPPDSDVRGEKMINPIEGEGYACTTVEDYIRKVDGLRSADSWTPEDQMMYISLIDNAPKEILGLTDEDLAELRTYTPGNGDAGKKYGIYARENAEVEPSSSDTPEAPTEPSESPSGDGDASLEGHYDQVERERRNEFARESLSFKSGDGYALLGDRKIVIDFGEDRPNQTDTYIEQESGDFHINYLELVNSANVAIELESLVSSFMDLIYPEYTLKDINMPDLGLVQIDLPWDELKVNQIDNEMNSLHDESKEISDSIGTIADQIANFINCIRYADQECDELFTQYFKKLSLSEIRKIVDSGEYSIHVNAVEKIINRYLEHDLNKYDLTAEESALVAKALRLYDTWDYHHMDGWSKFRADASTFILSVGYGLDKKGEQFIDGVLSVGMLGFEAIAEISGDEELRGYYYEAMKSFRDIVAESGADIRYATAIDYLGVNTESAEGSWHTVGANVGETTGDILIKLATAYSGMGPVSTVGILSMPKQGKAVQEIAGDEELSDEAFAEISKVYLAVNVAASMAEKAVGNIATKDEFGIYDASKLRDKVAGIVTITFGKEYGKAYAKWITATDKGEYDGEFLQYCAENGLDEKSVTKTLIETVVNTCVGEWDNPTMNAIDKIRKNINKATKTYTDYSGDERFKDVEIDKVGGYVSQIVDVF